MDSIIADVNERLLYTPDHPGNGECNAFTNVEFWEMFPSNEFTYNAETFAAIDRKIAEYPLINNLPRWSKDIIVTYIASEYEGY
jgi:hypothetical protein